MTDGRPSLFELVTAELRANRHRPHRKSDECVGQGFPAAAKTAKFLLPALAAGCLAAGCLGGALSAEIVADGIPPENSEFVASLIGPCITETQKFWFAPSVRDATRICSMRVHGLTVQEYVALSGGCVALGERRWILDLCASAIDKKLRPMMVPPKVPDKRRPEHPAGLTAAELGALEAGCDMVSDAGNKELCRSGIKKIKELILEPPEMQKD